MDSQENLKILEKILLTIKDKSIYGPVLRPHFNDIGIEAWCSGSKDTLGFATNTFLINIIFNGGERAYWIIDKAELNKNYLWFKKNTKKVYEHFLFWQEEAKEFINLIDKIAENKFEPLVESYQLIVEKFHYEFGRATIPEAPSMVGERDINKIKDKYKISDEDLFILLKEPHLSFLAENNLGLLRIAFAVGNQLANTYESLNNKIKQLIKVHRDKYFWIENGYYEHKKVSGREFWKNAQNLVKGRDQKKIKEEINGLENYELMTKIKKAELIKKYSMSKKDADFLKIFPMMIWWQDARKKTGLYMNYAVGVIMEVAAKKFRVPFIDLHFMIAPEFIQFLKFNGKYDKEEIVRRQKLFISINDDKGERVILSGNKYLAFAEKIIAQDIENKESILRGIAASMGRAKGRVRVILNPKGAKFQKGDILVAGVRGAEYVPLMKKAAAIVTDEGGITCHAAIISRELKIPCIIGTKIATKVLKDGDLVEVNAEKGIAKILKRKI